MLARIDGLRTLELGSPGELREWLNGLVLAGTKQAGLLELDYRAESENVEHVGERLVLMDDTGARLAEVAVTAVQIVPSQHHLGVRAGRGRGVPLPRPLARGASPLLGGRGS